MKDNEKCEKAIDIGENWDKVVNQNPSRIEGMDIEKEKAGREYYEKTRSIMSDRWEKLPRTEKTKYIEQAVTERLKSFFGK